MGNFIRYYLGGLVLTFGLFVVLDVCNPPYPTDYGKANFILLVEGFRFFVFYAPVAYLVYGLMVYKQEMPTPVFFVTLLLPACFLAIIRFIYYRDMVAEDKYWSYAYLMLVPIASFLSGTIIFLIHAFRKAGYNKGNALNGAKNDFS
ncbi:MAG: hypothetical protein AVDCRST_MAG56-3462 [uncultured Cytophagales bacterium]|uniref:Uncharacterized protein n=1 Tax=uncultured Cytophagales bacterium TaxID=158755 RepID=A0A6J4JBA3_9SPHI|nr:MAG: hypothetical protein AVDCRST_MAG56-3462 [uncultured Cytophagales bacterium]